MYCTGIDNICNVFPRGAFTMAQHLARGCFRMGTMSTRHEDKLDRLLKMTMDKTKTTCGQAYGLRGWWGSEPGDRQLNCRAGSIPGIGATELHNEKQIFYNSVQ